MLLFDKFELLENQLLFLLWPNLRNSYFYLIYFVLALVEPFLNVLFHRLIIQVILLQTPRFYHLEMLPRKERLIMPNFSNNIPCIFHWIFLNRNFKRSLIPRSLRIPSLLIKWTLISQPFLLIFKLHISIQRSCLLRQVAQFGCELDGCQRMLQFCPIRRDCADHIEALVDKGMESDRK